MLPRTFAALEHAGKCPEAIGDPQIRQLIAQQIIVLAVAEAETLIEKIVVEHFESTTTIASQNLVKSCLALLLRSVKSSEIAGFLGRLGDDCKTRFRQSVMCDEALETKYNNLVISRHAIVHEAQCNVTFEELPGSVAAIDHICQSLKNALSGCAPPSVAGDPPN